MYKCKLCKKEFKTKHGLKGHLEKKTPCVSKHQCELCGKIFKTKQILEKHYKRKTPCVKDTKSKTKKDSKNIPKYSKIFQNLPILESTDSNSDIEIITNLKPKCEYCKKNYSTKYNLNKHLKICKSKMLFEKTQKVIISGFV